MLKTTITYVNLISNVFRLTHIMIDAETKIRTCLQMPYSVHDSPISKTFLDGNIMLAIKLVQVLTNKYTNTSFFSFIYLK